MHGKRQNVSDVSETLQLQHLSIGLWLNFYLMYLDIDIIISLVCYKIELNFQDPFLLELKDLSVNLRKQNQEI